MLHGDTVEALRGLEAAFGVSEWSVDGVHVWPILRTQLAAKMMATGRPAPSPVPALGGWSVKRTVEAARAGRQFFADAVADVPHHAADVVFLGRPTNRQWLGDRWVDRFFDPIADVLAEQGLSTLHLEYRASHTRYRTPRHRPSLAIRPAVIRQLASAAVRLPRRTNVQLDGYRALARAVAKTHGVRIGGPAWLALRAKAVLQVASHFGDILERVRPRAVMCTCYYSLVSMALSLAASRAGIRSIDIQHGVTHRNPAYDGWTRFPAGGYALLPRRFWCWTDEDAAPIGRWPEDSRPHHRAFVGGQPWAALWQSDHPMTARYLDEIAGMRGDGLNVLITLTWSSGWSRALQRILHEAPRSWRWWIRLHPIMEAERPAVRRWCAQHAPGRAFVDQPTDLPLPLLLQKADVHLTHNSTVVQEATAAGTPSVLIDRHGLDVYTDELGSGWAQFAEQPEAVFAALNDQSRRKGTLSRVRPYPSWRQMSHAVRELLHPGPK